MLIAVERLLIKVRQPASRAAELIALRQRFRVELTSEVDGEERSLAADVQASKLAVAADLGAVTSCGACAAGQPWPRGAYAGGDCCSGVTAELFDDNEVAALTHAGTRPRDLIAPRGQHPGCAFRGADGCTLEVQHRPGRCVHYVCATLRRELRQRGRLAIVEDRLRELDRRMRRYVAVRRERLERELRAPLVAALEAHALRSSTARGR